MPYVLNAFFSHVVSQFRKHILYFPFLETAQDCSNVRTPYYAYPRSERNSIWCEILSTGIICEARGGLMDR